MDGGQGSDQSEEFPLEAFAPGSTPDIVGQPPKPEPSAYAEPTPSVAAAVASSVFVDEGAGEGNTGREIAGIKRHLSDFENRLKRFEDAHTTLAEAGSEAVSHAKDELFQAIASTKVAVLDEAMQSVTERLERLKSTMDADRRRAIDNVLGEAAESVEGAVGRIQGEIGVARKDLNGEINALRNDVGAKASRGEVDSLSDAIGSLRGDIAASSETVKGLKGTDDARRETLDALNQQVHGLVGTMETFEGRIGAFARDTEEARGELEALRQADTSLNAELTRVTTRVRGIEQTLEELKGAFRGIRDEALPDVRRAAIRAEQAATAASAQVAELLPRLEYVEGFATKMRGLQNFMDRVMALEELFARYPGDIVELATQVGLRELADELRGSVQRS